MQAPIIFQFTSLEAYLNQYLQYRKALNPSFSYALWARKLGVKSPATLHMVTKGQRCPGKNLVAKFQKDLALAPDEAKYFQILVNLKKHKSNLEPSLELMKELEDRHPEKGFRLLEQDEFRFISNWYSWALLEMVSLKGFKEDPKWISSKLEFPVADGEIREAISTMERLKLLGRDRNGKLVRTSRPLKTTSDKVSQAIQDFHYQCLKNAQESIRKHTVEQRNFENLTLSMSSDKIPQAKKMIREFVDKFCRTFDDPRANQIHQVGLALIPLTQKLQEKR